METRPCRDRHPDPRETADACAKCRRVLTDPRFQRLWGESHDAPPGLLARLGRFARAAARHVAAGRPKVTPEQHAARLAVCDGPPVCPEKKGNSCRLCGCNLRLKSSWATQDCPAGKWPALTPAPGEDKM